MYLLYLDDSGSPLNHQEDYFVLGGICVPERTVRWFSRELDLLAEQICPNAPEQVEFHAAEIFSGSTFPWTNFSEKTQRIEIIKSVLNVIQHAFEETVIFACAIHKASFPNDDPVLLAFEDIAGRFDFFITRKSGESQNEHNQKGIIIVDKTSYESGLQRFSSDIRRNGNRWGRQNRNICEVPMFVDSKASRLIQMADHISYATFRRYNAGDLNYFNCIQNRFDRDGMNIHGLVHKQSPELSRNCTCPACLTRRNRG